MHKCLTSSMSADVDPGKFSLHGERRPHRSDGVVSLDVWHTKHGHNGIANVFIEYTAMLKHRVNHTREVIIEEFDGLLSAQRSEERRVGKECRTRREPCW